MKTYCITFSRRYRSEVHPVQPDIDPDGYVTLKAHNGNEAHAKAYSVFNAYYDEITPRDYFDVTAYPLGELYTIG